MYRQPSTNASGKPFDAATVEAVWNKAALSPGHSTLRLDARGTLIWKEGYSNTNSKFGWVIGRVRPLNEGGGDELENLEPLQWENYRLNGNSKARAT
jgi:hypothetical protein